MAMIASIPARLKLDNAANIYPASMSKNYCSLYRMQITMIENIDVTFLQEALEIVSFRLPIFRYTLHSGMFWWYLNQCEANPLVRPLKPLKNFRFKDQDGLLYRVSAQGKNLYLDVFHALADGTGAMTFLATLAGEYIRRRYGISIRYNSLVLDPKDSPAYAEIEDSFHSVFGGRHGQLEKSENAYHIRGTMMPFGTVKDLRMVLRADEINVVRKQYGCTVTDLLTAAMLYALQQEHRLDPDPRKNSVLKVSVPVNLRHFYSSRTVRNFASYVNLGVDIREGYLPFEELVSAVKTQKAIGLQKENLEPKIVANVELENMLIVKMLPLMVKQPIISLIYRLKGDRFFSHTLSNLGNLNIPQEMIPYIQDIDFSLGKQRGNSGAAACVGYNGKLYLHMTRQIFSDRFEQAFLSQLQRLGLSVQTQEYHLA